MASTESDGWAAEHRLARLVQLGIRQARYFGRAKTQFQLYLAATVANLTLMSSKTGLGGDDGSDNYPTEAAASVRRFIRELWRVPVRAGAVHPGHPNLRIAAAITLLKQGFPAEFPGVEYSRDWTERNISGRPTERRSIWGMTEGRLRTRWLS